jgi:proline iminopeptidase
MAPMTLGPRPSSEGRLIAVRGTRLFVDVYGEPTKAALLYLHGGPGFGCHEFTRWQAGLLGRALRLIAFDQRGVLRSDPVSEEEPVTEDILVEDCEALRQALGVERWAVLGHSFGGRLALRYADKYPARVTSLLFENPCWDAEATERYRLPALGALYDSLGETSLAQECRDLAVRPDMYAGGVRLDLLFGLAPRGAYWYLADKKFQRSMEEAGLELPSDDHTEVVAMRLINDPGIYESLLPMLSGLQMPALLIVGKSDVVTSPGQIEAFRDQVPHGRVEVFDHSGHFVQLEQAEEYSALVTEFVLQNQHLTDPSGS